MECQDARMMLAFNDRPSEALDPVEGQALQGHLEACPDCAQAAERQQADRSFDQMIGLVMRDVAMPIGQPAKLKSRLRADRPATWKRWSIASAAAAVVFAVTAAGVYYANRPTEIDTSLLVNLAHEHAGMDADGADSFFKDRGLDIRSPREFDFSLLRNVEVIVVKSRRVAKLTFVARDESARVSVLVLPHREFRFTDGAKDIQADISVRFTSRDEFTYVIYHEGRGSFDAFMRNLN